MFQPEWELLIGKETDNVEEVEKDYLAFDAKIHPESMHISPKNTTPETQIINSVLEDFRAFLIQLLRV